MCECFGKAGDEHDNTVLMICGHRPDCPEFKINPREFTQNIMTEAKRIAELKFLSEKAKLEERFKNLYAPSRKYSITEFTVQVKLFRWLERKGHKLIAPNIKIFTTGEMDVCSVMKSGLVNEYEIKLSRADFKKDFTKKDKHPVFEKILKNIWSENKSSFNNRVNWTVQFSAPNYFYFVVPKDLISVEEIPDYAGLIYFNPENTYDIETVVRAKKLHSNLITDSKRNAIKNKLMWRCWTAKETVENFRKNAR